MDISERGFSSDLPVFDFRQRIIDAVDTNQVTIITAETGAGKSTQVPQYLAEHGYTKVVVTQPRILAARNLSRRVREEWAGRTLTDSTPIIGYRTAHERDDSPETQILYCTDGLQLVREITGAGITERQVLVLDEVHEWNENMEVLVAWAKRRCQEEPRFKVVIMSATIETDALADFYGGAAIINVPGRSFPVKKQRGTDVMSEILTKLQLAQMSNMLVFLPGKAEIQDVSDVIAKKAAAVNVPIIPLHSQLEATAQQAAFAHYPNGKVILATNIAQTSVTIDDIDVVIDSGLERRSEVRNGVEGLFIAQISQADCLQRAGRAGRTKPGEYILAPYDTLPCLDFNDRPLYATPEILRKHIDRLALRLANVGLDIESLEFYHEPSRRAIQRAKRTLIALGALTASGDVTRIGRAMEHYPVESSYARMLVEAQSAAPEVQTKLAAIIAIQEVGGIVKSGPRYTGWRAYTRQTKSDLLAQYDVLLALSGILPEEYEELGIISKNVAKAREVMQRLNADLRDIQVDDTLLTPITRDEQPVLLRCIVAGQIDQLWSVNDDGTALHVMTRTTRELSSSTVVRNPKLVTGTPFDLQVPTRDGSLQTLHLVQGVTAVDVAWLVDLAPHQFDSRRGRVTYDPRAGRLVTRQQVRAGKRVFEGAGEPITKNTKQNQQAFHEAFSRWVYEQLERERAALSMFHAKRIPAIPLPHIKQQVKSIAGSVIALDELSSQKRQQLLALTKLATHLGENFMQSVAASYRRQHSPGRHHAHRGCKPAHKRSGRHRR
ncbi:helicase-related protein [Streptomyces caniscabiei]|uniref:helicase-related protein n=1 Tax=Streptomyces caniscabiei TaxID=2746961 RepID=UPI0029BEBD4F|nr:helicase-related protein [Streptomyces caniscabiei]MDX2776057.1 helicase-related protein [Streptomyces caniscabiei]